MKNIQNSLRKPEKARWFSEPRRYEIQPDRVIITTDPGSDFWQRTYYGFQNDNQKGYQLYFYKNETTKKEIDVIIQKDGKVVPIEVKSGNTRANLLKSIMKNNKDISYGYKFIDGNVGTSEEGIITLPLYMIAFFDKVSE